MSASDLDPCAATGVTLSWNPATFGGSGGTYKVWRDGVVVQTGVLASPYTDVPGDTATHSYKVTAVSNDCGREDANTVAKPAADATGDPTPTPSPGSSRIT